MTGLRRHKSEGGYQRGEETRARIIRAAVALFGEKGFDGVSTREIAAEASVPAPSLQYYFENKEGLYAACLDRIQAEVAAALQPALEAADAVLASASSTAKLIDAYCTMLDALAEHLMGTPDAASRALFVARLKMPSKTSPKIPYKTTPSSVARSSPGMRLQARCAAIVARISGMDEDKSRLVATTLTGQLLTVHLAREHLKTMTGWDELTPDRLAELKKTIRRQTTVLLKTYARDRDRTAPG
jgi:AcrR family transcriptional regulator